MYVFFYGLFMSESLLAEKGLSPEFIDVGYVDGYSLCIGERATLIPAAGACAYGAIMNIASKEIKKLYAEISVADYQPESLIATLNNGDKVEATCYNLPVDKIKGTNQAYAGALLQVATRLGFPEHYLAVIRQAGD